MEKWTLEVSMTKQLWNVLLRLPSIPNFSGQSRIFRACPEKKYEVIRDDELSKFRILSRICPDLTSRCVAVQAVDQNAVDNFDVSDWQSRQRCILFSSICIKSIFGDPAGEVYDTPRFPSQMGMAMPPPDTSPSLTRSRPPRKVSRISVTDLWSPYVLWTQKGVWVTVVRVDLYAPASHAIGSHDCQRPITNTTRSVLHKVIN